MQQILSRSLSRNHLNVRVRSRTAKIFGGLLFSAGGLTYVVENDEGLKRQMKFNSAVAPVWIHYRYVDWKTKNAPEQERNEAFTTLHKK
jgi:uncharacterized membrane protein